MNEQAFVLSMYDKVSKSLTIGGVFKSQERIKEYLEDCLSMKLSSKEISSLRGFSHGTVATDCGEVFSVQKYNVY
jgi:hypothetical protein